MTYDNQKEVHLMIWEENPNKRNVNNEIKFNILKTNTVDVGDKIRCRIDNGKFSCYELTEIIDSRQSSISNMNYVTAKTKHFVK